MDDLTLISGYLKGQKMVGIGVRADAITDNAKLVRGIDGLKVLGEWYPGTN